MDPARDAIPDQELRPLVDRLLLEQGRLDPLELLLAADLLGYEDYVAWRTGGRSDLQGVLRASPKAIAGFLEDAGVYARGQKLVAVALSHNAWGDRERPLSIGPHTELSRACTLVYAPPPERCQLDLFQDSTALLLEEEVRTALVEHRMDRARDRVARLMHHEPGHPRLGGFLRLIQTLDDVDAVGRDGRVEERWRELEGIGPLAGELLGHRARDFLGTLWAGLAECLTGRAFGPGSGDFHAAIAWTRAGRWERAREAIESEPDWLDQPVLVLVHAEACWRVRDPFGARRDWLWLCREYPSAAERAFRAPAFPDRRLADLWAAFGDLGLEDELATEDFPAWLLLEDPKAFAVIRETGDTSSDDRATAYRLLHALVSGDDTIDRRRELGEIQPILLKQFLAYRRHA
ncbi:hypothetical protein [Thiocapsa marina]|uniref:Uncharacterized protein n=1 Tax=Thiocapsa marina 5811 TaxID=768671 RepID=F9UI53_9GAMM|nr:hypothetical protein [Thiocapsa marina]EGV16112.1 hypothetical protein ThimaDRAFT_4606 [Thiocapsa marina 5811]